MQEFLCNRNGKHCQTYAKPTHLCETDHCTWQPAAFLSKAAVCQHVKGKACFGANVTKCTCIGTKNNTTQNQGSNKSLKVQACGKILANPHAGREKGESHHNHKHAQSALASLFCNSSRCVVHINTFNLTHMAIVY